MAIGNIPAAVARERVRGRWRPRHTFPRVWVETPAPPVLGKETTAGVVLRLSLLFR